MNKAAQADVCPVINGLNHQLKKSNSKKYKHRISY